MARISWRRWLATATTAVVAASTVVVGLPSAASATPADDIIEQAATLERSIQENGEAIEALSEQYNAATARLALAQRQIEFGRRSIAGLAGRRAALAAQARAAVVALYQSDGATTPLASFRRPNDPKAGHRAEYTSAARRQLQETADQYTRVERQLAKRARSIDRFHSEVAQETAIVAAARAHAQELEVRQRLLLGKVQGDLADVLRIRRAAQDPDSASLELRLRTLGVGALPAPVDPRAAEVVSYAIRQLGKPYVFAAAGPETFDCSGLTLMAWRQVGVSMAHFAAAQYAAFPKVSIDDLAPGDLVFFYPTIHHVGIYIGGGKMIHAPHTGDVVRVSSIFRASYVGAVRPGTTTPGDPTAGP